MKTDYMGLFLPGTIKLDVKNFFIVIKIFVLGEYWEIIVLYNNKKPLEGIKPPQGLSHWHLLETLCHGFLHEV